MKAVFLAIVASIHLLPAACVSHNPRQPIIREAHMRCNKFCPGKFRVSEAPVSETVTEFFCQCEDGSSMRIGVLAGDE